MITPIETAYAGCRFRSRLEARWATLLDAAGIRWEYEPEGYRVGPSRRPYLPDFLLVDCGTWVEVKGSSSRLDTDLMINAAHDLPAMPFTRERGPRLLIVGPIPEPLELGDWGWLGLSPDSHGGIHDYWWGLGNYDRHLRPWVLAGPTTPYVLDAPRAEWLVPVLDEDAIGIPHAYRAARSARFEHEERCA